jgi:hypothetical protein
MLSRTNITVVVVVIAALLFSTWVTVATWVVGPASGLARSL